MAVVAIIQARLDSSRLPGKVLKMLGHKEVLLWTYDAAKEIVGVDHVLIATSDEASDDPIQDFCNTRDIPVFRGSKNDVLGRMVNAAQSVDAHTVIRLTADCPFLDPHVASNTLYLFKRHSCDYASNIEPTTWPDGLDTEIVSLDTLKNLHAFVKNKSDREHVTRYIRQNQSQFVLKNFRSPDSRLAQHRWTLDTVNDYTFLNAIACAWDNHTKAPGYLDILQILDKNPAFKDTGSGGVQTVGSGICQDFLSNPNTVFKRSEDTLKLAERYIPLGSQTFSKSRVQFPVGHSPLFLSHGRGGRVWDVDGNEYADMVSALLPIVLGYCDPDVDDAIINQINKGVSFSLSTELEHRLASKLVKHIPCAEKVRFGKNGTDATSAAIRLSRAFTGKDHVVVCGYHGWQDWYIGSTTRYLGVPKAVRDLTIKVPFNDIDALEHCFKEKGNYIACFIMEVCSVDEPHKGYLQSVKDLCHRHNIVLVFDEVITGFRFNIGGAQAHYGVSPDLACFGKAMANGMPLSTIVGRADIMDVMEDIFYSGTFGGEALSLAASLAVIEKMEAEPVIQNLWDKGKDLGDFVQGLIAEHKLEDVFDLKGVDPWRIMTIKGHKNASVDAIKTRYIITMVRNGVLTFGAHNLTYAHSDNDMAIFKNAYAHTMALISEQLRQNSLLDNLEVAPLVPVFKVR